MVKCLVCWKEKSGGPDTCKMCGMAGSFSTRESGFLFCCAKCAGHFRKAISLEPGMMKGVSERVSVV